MTKEEKKTEEEKPSEEKGEKPEEESKEKPTFRLSFVSKTVVKQAQA